MMKKSGREEPQVLAQLGQLFDTCHHCKQLLPNAVLVGCNYRSSKTGAASVESDNLLLELSDTEEQSPLLRQQSTAANRGARKRSTPSSYMAYTRRGISTPNSGDEFVCLRKYCKNCIRNNYSGVFEGDLCPFCLG